MRARARVNEFLLMNGRIIRRTVLISADNIIVAERRRWYWWGEGGAIRTHYNNNIVSELFLLIRLPPPTRRRRNHELRAAQHTPWYQCALLPGSGGDDGVRRAGNTARLTFWKVRLGNWFFVYTDSGLVFGARAAKKQTTREKKRNNNKFSAAVFARRAGQWQIQRVRICILCTVRIVLFGGREFYFTELHCDDPYRVRPRRGRPRSFIRFRCYFC